MINKQKLWFLTLFTLILVLSVYYVTMPNDLLNVSNNVIETNAEKDDGAVVEIKESDALSVLRIMNDEDRLKMIEDLNLVLSNVDSTIEQKNNAYEELKLIEEKKGKEELLESKIKENFNMDSVITINNNQIKVTTINSDHNYELANNIMRSIQEEYDDKMYITVKFES